MAFVELPFHPMATKASVIDRLPTPCFDVGDYQQMEIELKIVSGFTHPLVTPGFLHIEPQHSMDMETWHELSPIFTPMELLPGTRQEVLSYTGFLRYVRAWITIAGDEQEGPLIATFSLLGIARNGL
jgi:hypothetical protein